MLVSVNVDHAAVLRRPAGRRRRRGARLRRRRPRLAPARRAGAAHQRRRPAAPAGRPVRHRRQPGRAAGLAAGLRARRRPAARVGASPLARSTGRRRRRSAGRRRRGDVELDYVGSLANAATVIAALHRGEKRLVFCDSRQTVEELGAAAAGARRHRPSCPTPRCRSTNGAAPSRRSPRRATASSSPPAPWNSASTSATSTGSSRSTPRAPSPSFLQRLGRTGRRPGTTRQLPVPGARRRRAAARRRPAARCGADGWVEPVVAAARAAAHRRPAAPRAVPAGAPGRRPALAAVVERPGAVRPQRRADRAATWSSRAISTGRRHAVHRPRGRAALRAPALHGHDRRLHRPTAVHRPGRAHRARPHRPSLLTEKVQGPRLLLLGGRSWQVTYIDWNRRRCFVEPADGGGKARWLTPGSAGPASS